MEKFSILKSMHNEHLELEKMANKAMDGFEMNKNKRLELFESYTKRLEHHIKMEEKAIYSISQNLDSTLQALIRQIFSDHEKIRYQVRQIFDSIKKEEYVYSNEFFSLIKSHHLLEDRSFYAKLDSGLSLEEKYRFKTEFEKNS